MKLGLPLVAIGVVAVAWSIAWKLVADSTETALDDWFAQERGANRVWSCSDRTVSGFPVNVTVRCAGPTFVDSRPDRHVEGSVGEITAGAALYNPGLISGGARPPLRVSYAGDVAEIDGDWRDLRVAYESSNGSPRRGQIEVDGLNLKIRAPVIGETTLGAANLRLVATPDGRDAASLAIAGQATAIVAPALDGLLGQKEPLDGDLTATLSHVDRIVANAGNVALDRWRRAGGELTIVSLDLRKGDMDVAARGGVQLDEAHRARGHIDIAASGLEATLERYGIPGAVLALGQLFGGNAGSAGALGKPGAARAALTLENGRASLGPIRLPIVLQPVY